MSATEITLSGIKNFFQLSSSHYLQFIASIINFRDDLCSKLEKEYGFKFQEATLSDPIRRQNVSEIDALEKADLYYFELVPYDIKLGSRKLLVTVNEKGEVNIDFFSNTMSYPFKWKMVKTADLKFTHPSLYPLIDKWIPAEELSDGIEYIAGFMKEK